MLSILIPIQHFIRSSHKAHDLQPFSDFYMFDFGIATNTMKWHWASWLGRASYFSILFTKNEIGETGLSKLCRPISYIETRVYAEVKRNTYEQRSVKVSLGGLHARTFWSSLRCRKLKLWYSIIQWLSDLSVLLADLDLNCSHTVLILYTRTEGPKQMVYTQIRHRVWTDKPEQTV